MLSECSRDLSRTQVELRRPGRIDLVDQAEGRLDQFARLLDACGRAETAHRLDQRVGVLDGRLASVDRPQLQHPQPLRGRLALRTAGSRRSGGTLPPRQLRQVLSRGSPVLGDLRGIADGRGVQQLSDPAVRRSTLVRQQSLSGRLGEQRVPE